jgi:DNA integrity scanning protein DisA with diadenylate cyclase activity
MLGGKGGPMITLDDLIKDFDKQFEDLKRRYTNQEMTEFAYKAAVEALSDRENAAMANVVTIQKPRQ